jgi:glycosyltransferase involved in cell wall biosynthesis
MNTVVPNWIQVVHRLGLFDYAFYNQQLVARGASAVVGEVEAFAHWSNFGVAQRIVPTPLFDSAWYAAIYLSGVDADEFSFRNFVEIGLTSNRSPTPWLEPGWYQARHGVPRNVSAFEHWLFSETFPLPHPGFQGWLQVFGAGAAIGGALTDRVVALGALTQATAGRAEVLSAEAFTALAALFDPRLYRETAGLDPTTSDLDAFVDFICRGLALGLSPSRLFDAGFYQRNAASAGLRARETRETPYEHWLRHGVPARVVPTPMFDSEYYIERYKDVREGKPWSFAHFVLHGINERRAFSPWFDVRWYENQFEPTLNGLTAARHFLTQPESVTVPRGGFESWTPADADGWDWLGALTQATLGHPDHEVLRHAALLIPIFHPASYKRAATLDPQASALEAFVDFLTRGFHEGLRPTPLFDSAHYLSVVEGTDIPPPARDVPPLLHWLEHGVPARIIPTPLFDEPFYTDRYRGRLSDDTWPFLHYLRQGMWEELDVSPWINSERIRHDMETGENTRPSVLFFFDEGTSRDLSTNFGFDAWRNGPYRRLFDNQVTDGAGALSRLTRATQQRPWNRVAGEAALIAAMFDPESYARSAGSSPMASQTELFAEFLESGYQHHIDACPYFDAEFYAGEARKLGLPQLSAGQSPFLHWLVHGLPAGASPSVILSVPTSSPDEVKLIYLDLLRSPALRPAALPWFDGDWYGRRYEIDVDASLRHFVTIGAGAGCVPLPGLQAPWFTLDLKQARSPEERQRKQFDFLARLAAESASLTWGGVGARVQWAASIFMPEWYIRAAALRPDTRPLDAFFHFIGSGMTSGLPPTPFFDAHFYRGLVARDELSPLEETGNAFLHWLQHGLPARLAPSPLFDEAWYLENYSDTPPGEWAFFTFASDKIRTGRSATPFFRAGWYEARYKVGKTSEAPGFWHYLTIGSFQGWLPHPSFEAWTLNFGASRTRAAGVSQSEGIRFLAEFTQSALAMPVEARIHVGMAIALFVPDYYKQVAGLAKDVSAIAAFAHFLSKGLADGLRPSPLFSGETYRRKLEELEMSSPGPSEQNFVHWLATGVPERIVPTVLYDERYQTQTYADLKISKSWNFEHFLIHGSREGRNPNPMFATAWYLGSHVFTVRPQRPFYHYLLQGASLGWRPCADFGEPGARADTGGEASLVEETALERVLNLWRFDNIQARFETGVLADVIGRLKAIDPTVTRPLGYRRLIAPPYSHALWPVVKRVRQSLPRPNFTNVVCIPHCRLSGAARVAGYLTQALEQLYPGEPTLLVRTELSNFERPNWFSNKLHNLNLSAELGDLNGSEKQRVLLDLLIGVEPKRIFNVNSNLAWHLFRDFGDRLQLSSDLYAYMFCYDIDLIGEKTGYPIEFFETTFPYLKKILVDSDYLRSDLTERHVLPPHLASRIARLWTPADNITLDNATCAPLQAERLARREPAKQWRALWAGRLDRQKRFDIVEQIAARMPELEISAFGASVLDDAKVSSQLPSNLTLHNGFEDFSSLPLDECDFLLYTSQWDGVPTILIDAACCGMPVVGSKIWGTADLLSDETAFPVEDVTNPDAYIDQIRALMADPASAVAKARQLRALAATHHAPARYLKELGAALADEVQS